MGGSGVTARRNGIRQNSGMESGGNHAQYQEQELGQGNSHLGLVLLMGRQQTQGLSVFSQGLLRSRFCKAKKGTKGSRDAAGKGCSLHVGQRRDIC